MFSYAFNRGAFYAIYILAGQIIKPSLPNESDLDKKIGIAIMLLFVVGFAGSLLGGFLIDRKRHQTNVHNRQSIVKQNSLLRRYEEYHMLHKLPCNDD